MGALLLLSCSPDPVPGPEITVFAHQLGQCELPSGNARIELEALGDFDPSNRTTDSLSTDARGAALSFPPETVGVRASLTADRSARRFVALGRTRREGTLPLVLWPDARACPLSEPTPDYPSPGGGQGIGYSEKLGLVLLAGSDASQSGAVSGAMTFDTATGEVLVLPPGPRQLSRARAFPSITAFGDAFVVAGGEDPTVTFDSGRRNLRASAEIYDPVLGEFEDDLVELVDSRGRHRAVVLESGDTALIGGITESATGERSALAKIEILEVETRRATEGPLLSVARIDPSVVTLSDGRILVAGGETLTGELVKSLEWLSPDLLEGTLQEFETRFDQAFVALPGGAALAVGGCEEQEGSESECAPCRRGCRPSGGWDAFWIDAEGEVFAFPVDFPVARASLIPASDGSPWLVTRDEGGEPTLLRFDPWARVFRVDDGAGSVLPSPDRPALAIDAGAYLYVADEGDRARLWGRRVSTRNEYSHDSELVRVTHPQNTLWPWHLAPGQGLEDLTGLVQSDTPQAPWVLELAHGSAWITDTTYADFSLELGLLEGTTPRLLVAEDACSWPDHDTSQQRTLSAVRSGTVVTLSVDAAKAACSVGSGRVSLGLSARARSEPARLTRLSLARGRP